MANPEKPKPPMSDEQRMKQMGTDRVLDDLRQKYKLPPTDQTVSTQKKEALEKTGYSRVLADIKEKTRRFAEALEGVPYHSETISATEMRSIAMARKICREFVDRSAQYVRDLESQFGKGAEFETKKKEHLKTELANLERALDMLPIWKEKISTESEGGGASPCSEEPLTVNPETDSVYYITPSGSSLRLKKTIIDEGLGNVFSRFAERIIFVGPKMKISVQPIKGFSVREYFTETFSDRLGSENVAHDFNSRLRIYEKDGDIKAIVMPEDDTSEPHAGDRVNKIFTRLKGKGWR